MINAVVSVHVTADAIAVRSNGDGIGRHGV